MFWKSSQREETRKTPMDWKRAKKRQIIDEQDELMAAVDLQSSSLAELTKGRCRNLSMTFNNHGWWSKAVWGEGQLESLLSFIFCLIGKTWSVTKEPRCWLPLVPLIHFPVHLRDDAHTMDPASLWPFQRAALWSISCWLQASQTSLWLCFLLWLQAANHTPSLRSDASAQQSKRLLHDRRCYVKFMRIPVAQPCWAPSQWRWDLRCIAN